MTAADTSTADGSPYRAQAPTTLDVSGTPGITLTRLVRVELRKMVDTRAGMWLLITIALLTALITVVLTFAGSAQDHTFGNYMGVMATPQGFLLPVLGILLVTQEWGQRTGMVTFTLEPNRLRVILAKVIAALLLGLAAVILAVVLAAIGALLGGSSDPWGSFGIDDLGKFAILQFSGLLQGLAFGLIFLNSAAAIVTYFVVPIAFSVVSSIWSALHTAQPWIDLGTSQQPLFDGSHLSGEQWAQLGTGTLIWVIIPFVAGLWRVLRAELK